MYDLKFFGKITQSGTNHLIIFNQFDKKRKYFFFEIDKNLLLLIFKNLTLNV